MGHAREEEIARELERGELLSKLECGCVIIQDRTADAYIIYCPKHSACDDMYEALKKVRDRLRAFSPHLHEATIEEIGHVLARAKG